MTSDSGNLSIDFLVGFTIFMITFIWVVSMIPGLLINLQGYTIDYDAVAYRTGVILAEDPGEPSLPTSLIPWENLISREGVVRFGLAVSKDTPNILSKKKVDRFFCSSVFSYPADYQNRTIFGDYPYQFNISLNEMGGSAHPSRYVGEGMPATSSSGSIRRLVRIKEPAVAVVNASSYNVTGKYNKTAHPDYLSGDNETVHEFTILINKSELLEDKIRDPVYQINPGQEQIIINITHLDQTMYPNSTDGNLADRTPCFNISLTNITIKNEVKGVLVEPPLPPYKIFIDDDGKEYNSSSPLPSYIKYNISLIFDPPTYWSVTDKSYIKLKFKLVRMCPLDAPPGTYPQYNFTGSRFLNNTFTSPFGYNYSQDNVIQPHLQDAMLEVNVKSGARTVTEIVVEHLAAAFKYDVTSGSPTITLQFIDQSTGNPVEWDWDFGDATPHGTTSNPSHIYTTPGIKTVTLTVKDAAGNPKSVTKTIDLSAPVAAFSPAPGSPLLTGPSPLNVQFNDTSTGGAPTSWKWAYRNASVGWTQFAITQNTSFTFAEGNYDINLTATNAFGSDDEIKETIPFKYIIVSPIPPPTFVSAATNTAGNVITITFNKAMADPAGKQAQFKYSIGGAAAQSFSAAALNADNTKIDLTTSGTVIKAGDVVTVNYTVGTVLAADTGILAIFTNKPVTNNMPGPPTFVSAATNTAGNVITITFSKAMANPAGKQAQFKYSIGGAAAQSFSAAALNADNTKIDLTTSGTAIKYGDVVTINYTVGTVLAADTGVLATFTNKPVTNNRPVPTYTVVTFTTVGTTSWTVPAGVTSVEYLVVAGGGGGGNSPDRTGGGGGAGGVLSSTTYPVTAGASLTVIVGAGGNANTKGVNSQFDTITAIGGGRGGQLNSVSTIGGSGGGAYHNPADSGKAGTAGQGSAGGNGYDSGSRKFGAGGGGGQSAVGAAGTVNGGGKGGNGYTSTISGSSVVYAGGGGGGWQNLDGGAEPAGAGGTGGGGAGGKNGGAGTAGAANTGGGGGGGSAGAAGGRGGSGIVIIKYQNP